MRGEEKRTAKEEERISRWWGRGGKEKETYFYEHDSDIWLAREQRVRSGGWRRERRKRRVEENRKVRGDRAMFARTASSDRGQYGNSIFVTVVRPGPNNRPTGRGVLEGAHRYRRTTSASPRLRSHRIRNEDVPILRPVRGNAFILGPSLFLSLCLAGTANFREAPSAASNQTTSFTRRILRGRV